MLEICRTHDVVEDFNKLQQLGTMVEYKERFEELKSLMLVRKPHLSDSYFVSSFISGLRDEIKTMVKMLKPNKVSDAMELAQLQEEALQLQNKSVKLSVKTPVDPKFGLYKGNTPVPNAYKILHSNAFKGETNAVASTKKISPQEIQFRRNNGLCFKCGERFGVGQQCKNKQLNLMVVDEEEE